MYVNYELTSNLENAKNKLYRLQDELVSRHRTPSDDWVSWCNDDKNMTPEKKRDQEFFRLLLNFKDMHASLEKSSQLAVYASLNMIKTYLSVDPDLGLIKQEIYSYLCDFAEEIRKYDQELNESFLPSLETFMSTHDDSQSDIRPDQLPNDDCVTSQHKNS